MSVSRRISVVAGLMLAGVFLAAQGEPRRTISTGHPIEQQLRPEDRYVVLGSNLPPPLSVELSDAIHDMTDNTAVSFFGTVVRKESHLTEDRTWVTSTIIMRVDRAFKSAKSVNTTVGATVQFEDKTGGRIQFGNALIEAVTPWSRPISVGERYLVFGALRPDGSLITGPGSVYELARPQFGLARFRRLRASDQEPPTEQNEIEELLPDEVFDRIERRLLETQR